MPKPDDFDLIPRTPPPAPAPEPEEYDDGGSGGRGWRWLITLLSVAFLFFAIGAALFTLRERMGGDVTPTPRPATATPAGTTSGFLATLVALASPTSTVSINSPTPMALQTPSPMVTVESTPTPCAQQPAPAFAAIYRREVFGCPLAPGSQIVWAAWEPFERGSMLWRSDTDRSYLFTLGGLWRAVDAAWDGQPAPNRGDPPPGLLAPERGFGWAWGSQDELFQALGWATDAEKGFCAEVQEFEQGFFLQSSAVPSCSAENLYNQATAGDWRPIVLAAHASGVWSGTLGGASVVAPAPTRTMTVSARPASNGLFEARPGAGIVVDGQLDDWPAMWTPVDHVVEGQAAYAGSPDAYAVFQTAWTAGGLLLAAQVQDDFFRPGPEGTDMWQGDGLEIQLDSRLVEDFADTTANGDDFQIGVALAQNGTLRQFRWLPYGTESSLPAYGAGSGRDGGYRIEALIPWSVFAIDAVQAGSTFGFNVSVSDNDADSPDQQSLLSASPERSTFDNPSQWGTLVLLP